MVPQVGAVGRHLVLVGFMGAGKSTIGREVARLSDRPFVDTDDELERRHGPIQALFELGEGDFRRLEEAVVAETLAAPEPAVIALGGGAVTSAATRRLLAQVHTVWLDVDPDVAWKRAHGRSRPLARDEASFRRLHVEREPLYLEVCDGVAHDVEEVLLDGLQIEVERSALNRLDELSGAGASSVALVADERVLAHHTPELGHRLVSTHPVPSGESAKTLETAAQLWRELHLDRSGTVIALGGGSTTDVAGFVAATYLRGIRWLAVPTTLVGQVDAAIGGKTALNTAGGKNLVGAFHYPAGVVIDPDVLATLPEVERRAGLAEVVKTGLLAGRSLWELPEEELVRACAAFKAAVCLGDPFDEGRRAILNLGHTFGHALEAASDYSVAHGQAVALGLRAALRLSGQDTAIVDELLLPTPVPVDAERAWAALVRDKKHANGELRLVLLDEPGRPALKAVPERDVRAALGELIAG